MSRIRVLHIIWSATLGGIEHLVINLCKAQNQSSTIQPSVFIAKSEGGLIEQFKNLGISVYEAGFKKGNDHRKEIVSYCYNAFKEHDILHFHSFNPTLAKIAIKSDKKIIYTEHGNFGFGRNASLKDYVVRYLQKRFLNEHVNFITFNSGFSKNVAESRFNLSHVKRQVVYNGIPLTSNSETPIHLNLNIAPNKFKILTVGRLVTVKRIDRLIKAFAASDPTKMQLIITGDGPLRAELETLCKSLKIEEHVLFTGFQDSGYMMRNVADICVFPSQNEAFGLVAIEAYLTGKPVIVFRDGGGLAELIEKVEPDMLVNNEEELSFRLLKCLNSLNEINSEDLQIKRRNFASGFSIEKMENTLSTIYSNL